MTTLTLAGGLASTVFAPITAALAEHLGRRGTYLALAAILAVTALPLHAAALRHPWPPPPRAAGSAATGEDSTARSRPFIMLATAFTLSWFAMYAVVFTIVPLLTERGGSPTTTAWALRLGGLGQTLGRTLYAALARRTTVTVRTTATIAAGGATAALLTTVSGPAALLIAVAVLAGGVVRDGRCLPDASYQLTGSWTGTPCDVSTRAARSAGIGTSSFTAVGV